MAVARDVRRANRAGVVIEVRVARTSAEVEPALERLVVLHPARREGDATEESRFSTMGRQRNWYRRSTLATADRALLVARDRLAGRGRPRHAPA